MSDRLYEKTVNCPVCGRESKNKAVKQRAVRIESQDSDFCIHYKDKEVNPLLYGVTCCKYCGYAALTSYFEHIRDWQKDLIKTKISNQWVQNGTQYSLEIRETQDVNVAIHDYKLALFNGIVKEAKASEMASILLRLSWLYRYKGDSENERSYQKQALVQYEKAYMEEDHPIGNMTQWDLLYIIGELYRRQGDDTNALKYFSEIMISRNVDSKLKDKVRVLRDSIKDKSK